MSPSDVIWLDCTLRDGGYYNSWDFPPEIVQEYLFAMAECGATHVELGFRSLDKAGYKGPTAYTPDSFLASLTIPVGIQIGIMINTQELGESPDTISASLGQLLPPESANFVSFVRLATHLDEVHHAIQAAFWLKASGYLVGLNLMQVSEATPEMLSKTAVSLDPNAVDVLYMADSLGNLSPEDVVEITKVLATGWKGDIGIHAHDNAGLALANSLTAIAHGVRWVDSTITGMGRGAGNTPTELLLGHLARQRLDSPRSERLERLITSYFEPLRQEGRWGPNIHYVRAAATGIHPSFVQEMLGNAAYSSLEISAAIDVLASQDSQKFSRESLAAAESWISDANSPRGGWDQRDFFQGKRVLFVGSGGSVQRHKLALERLAQDPSVLVVAANFGSDLDSTLIDAHLACHPLRIISDSDLYRESTGLLIAPKSLIPAAVATELLAAGRLLDIGLEVSRGPSYAQQGLIRLERPQVLPFGLLVLLSGGAEEIYLAGFDGYLGKDPRRALEQGMVDDVLRQNPSIPVHAITPSEFSIPKTSVYGLIS